MIQIIVSSLFSVPLGALSSLFAWWILNYKIVPKIRFSDSISKLEKDGSTIYRFKFENSGSRDIYDAEIVAKLRIKGIFKKLVNNWEVIYLPLDNDKIPIIKSICKCKNRVREVPRIELEYLEKKYTHFFPKLIIDKINAEKLSLEDMFGLGIKSELQLIVSGYDAISGAKKVFISKAYTIGDIRNGYFNNNGLEIQ